MVKTVLHAQQIQDHKRKELCVQLIYAFQIKSQLLWVLVLIAQRVKCQMKIIKVFARMSQLHAAVAEKFSTKIKQDALNVIYIHKLIQITQNV